MADLVISKQDIQHLELLRANVSKFIARVANQYGDASGLLLDIAPQDHAGASPFFGPDITIKTFDIDPDSGCDYIGDICTLNGQIHDETFDLVICTEVLEHTLQPFNAVAEIWRMLKPGGLLCMTVPFNFRIHGPLPDCWRFTEHGLRALLHEFEIVELAALETADRPLMPIHYTAIARKGAG